MIKSYSSKAVICLVKLEGWKKEKKNYNPPYLPLKNGMLATPFLSGKKKTKNKKKEDVFSYSICPKSAFMTRGLLGN